MKLLFIAPLFSERFARALCWTLVHSLWQGLLLAVLTGLVILSTRKAAAIIRYRLFSILFALFLLGSGCTFMMQWNQAPNGAGAASGGIYRAVTDVPLQSEPVAHLIAGRLVGFFNAHADFLVVIWWMICAIRFLQITIQIGTIERFRYRRVHNPDAYWETRVQELARRLGIRIPIRLLESELVKVPMMAGLFKPLILLPFQLTTHLPAQEIEAILLHELAHIRRRDYLVNLLQSVAGALFFFNPGVLWLSALIREERENCCDDMAIGQGGSKRAFVNALVSFEAPIAQHSRFGLAFPGSGNHLLHRVKRIIQREERALDVREKWFLFFCLLVSGSLLLGFSHRHAVVTKKSPSIVTPLPSGNRTNGLLSSDSTVPEKPAKAVKPRQKDHAKKIEKAEKREKIEKPEKVEEKEKPEMTEEAEKAEKAEQAEKMEQAEKAEQAEKMEQAEKAEQAEKMEQAEQREKWEKKEKAERVEKIAQEEKAERAEQPERPEAAPAKKRIAVKSNIGIKSYDSIHIEAMKLSEEQKALADLQHKIDMEKKELMDRQRVIDQEQRAIDQRAIDLERQRMIENMRKDTLGRQGRRVSI